MNVLIDVLGDEQVYVSIDVVLDAEMTSYYTSDNLKAIPIQNLN